MKSNRGYSGGSGGGHNKSEGNRQPSTRSYSSVASQSQGNSNTNAAPSAAPIPAPAAVPTPVTRSSPATLSEEAAMNQIHAFVRGLSKTDKDVHRSAFIHLIQSMIGKEVQIDLNDGAIVTGVLHTTTFPLRRQHAPEEYFSGDFPKQVLLKASKLKQAGSSGRAFESGAALFIEYDDIIAISANVGDLHTRAVSADFRTDSSIKKHDIAHLAGRELQGVSDSWLDPSMATDLSAQGGKQWDQFETNRLKFNVKSTYDENLYTKKLDKSAFTAEQIARAERIAKEIEMEQSGNIHLLEERGLLAEREIDEEAMYSGVIRSDYQPEVHLAPTNSSHGNTPTASHSRNGQSNTGSAKSNKSNPPVSDAPWQRGLKLSADTAKKPVASPNTAAPVPTASAVSAEPVSTTTAPAVNPPPLAPAPGLIDRSGVPSPSGAPSQARDRVSPVRFGAFNEQPAGGAKTSTPTLESGFTPPKGSLDEANQKPLPALTPNPAIAAAAAAAVNNESISRTASGSALATSGSNHSLQDINKTPVKSDEDKANTAGNAASTSSSATKLNPAAKAWVPNPQAKEFKPTFSIPATPPAAPVAPVAAPVVHTPVVHANVATPVSKPVLPPQVPHVTPTQGAIPSHQQPHVGYGAPPVVPNYSTPTSNVIAHSHHESPAAQRLNPSVKNSPSVGPMMAPAITSSPSTLPIPPPANVPTMAIPAGYPQMAAYTPEQYAALQQMQYAAAYGDQQAASYLYQQQQQQYQQYQQHQQQISQQQYQYMMQQYQMANAAVAANAVPQQPYPTTAPNGQLYYNNNGQASLQPAPGVGYSFTYDQMGNAYQNPTGYAANGVVSGGANSYYSNAVSPQLQRSNSNYSQGSKGAGGVGGGQRKSGGGTNNPRRGYGGGGGYSQHNTNSPQGHIGHDNEHQHNDGNGGDMYSPESS